MMRIRAGFEHTIWGRKNPHLMPLAQTPCGLTQITTKEELSFFIQGFATPNFFFYFIIYSHSGEISVGYCLYIKMGYLDPELKGKLNTR